MIPTLALRLKSPRGDYIRLLRNEFILAAGIVLGFWRERVTLISMKMISIRQPWASLVVAGVKDVENRTWSTRYRGPVLIHASQRADSISSDEIERRFGIYPPSTMPLGGIVGIAEVVDCVKPCASKWYAPGHYAFVLANARSLPFVKWKGALSLRAAPTALLELVDITVGPT